MKHLLWQSLLGACAFILCSLNLQASVTLQSRPKSANPPTQTDRNTAALTATTVAAGQAGYVHYFVITHPDGTLEDHVGIEMEDQRIAWSFPGSGVSVAEFIKNGTVESDGKIYKVEHQYAVRPLRSAQEMQSLRANLTRRVAVWVDDETPYCAFRRPEESFCLSCGDFIVRIIFPSTNPMSAGLPRDFVRNLGQALTTDDLLLYMLGLHNLPNSKSRLDKLATLNLPLSLQKDVRDLLNTQQLADADQPAPAKSKARVATRKTQLKRL